MKYALLILIIGSFLLPVLILAQEQLSEPPATLEEAKELGEETLEVTKEEMPGILERIWKEEVLPFWQKMINELRSFLALCFTRAWDWTKNFWKDTLWPWIKGFWESRIKPPVEEEVEKRKEIAKESIEKEKEGLQKTFVPEGIKSLWQELKELVQ
jgi:hypothetical protein